MVFSNQHITDEITCTYKLFGDKLLWEVEVASISGADKRQDTATADNIAMIAIIEWLERTPAGQDYATDKLIENALLTLRKLRNRLGHGKIL
jgi:hypothetical protein